MGYSLVGSGSGSGYGIYSAGPSNVEIRNGTIRDFGKNGIIEADAGVDHRVINVRVIFNGRSGSYPGIYLTGKNHLLKGCTAQRNGSIGIYTGYACMVTANTVYSNNLSETVNWGGIYAYNDCLVKGNIVRFNNQNNIYVYGSDNAIEENLVTDCTGNGIYFKIAGNFYANNRASGNGTNYGGTLPSGGGDGGGNASF